MRPFETVEEAYDVCVSDGNIIPTQDIDRDKIRASLRTADEDILNAKDATDKKRWNSAYKAYYDVLHQLVEAFLKFENIKIKTHLCLFAYLCVKYPELELDWGFFEKVLTKRNGIQYYGNPVIEKDWKEVSLQFQLYIALIKKKIEEKLESYNTKS